MNQEAKKGRVHKSTIDRITKRFEKERINDGKPIIEIKPKHWWEWISPSFWERKKVLEAMSSMPAYKKKFFKEQNKLMKKLFSTPTKGKNQLTTKL